MCSVDANTSFFFQTLQHAGASLLHSLLVNLYIPPFANSQIVQNESHVGICCNEEIHHGMFCRYLMREMIPYISMVAT